jgi:hypothetical protein
LLQVKNTTVPPPFSFIWDHSPSNISLSTHCRFCRWESYTTLMCDIHSIFQ